MKSKYPKNFLNFYVNVMLEWIANIYYGKQIIHEPGKIC